MRLEFTIDWLQFSKKGYPDMPAVASAYPCGDLFTREACARGYNQTISNAHFARISWHSTRPEQGTMIQYGGKSLNVYLINGIRKLDIAKFHVAKGDKATRIDLAIDVYDSGLDIAKYHRRIIHGKAKTRLKGHALIESDKGTSLYVGSRTSEQFLRVYDKALEQEIDQDWKRVEIELKGDRAMVAAKAITAMDDQGVAQFTQQSIRALVDFDTELWTKIVSDIAVPIAKSEQHETDTVAWLLGLVAPAMGKYIAKNGDNGLTEKFMTVVAGFADPGEYARLSSE